MLAAITKLVLARLPVAHETRYEDRLITGRVHLQQMRAAALKDTSRFLNAALSR